jgi:hypothetical protein
MCYPPGRYLLFHEGMQAPWIQNLPLLKGDGLGRKSVCKELYNRTHDLDVEGISDYIFHEPRTRSNGRPPFTGWALSMDFETHQEAGAAKDRLHNLKLFGRRLHVRYAGLRLADGSTGTGTAKESNLEA